MPSFAASIVVFGLVVGSLAEWKPADGVHELDAVEQALYKVENAVLTPDQKKLANRAVGDVEKVVMQLKSDKKLTKEEKKEKVKGAILKLQGLQSQWELSAVEGTLNRIVELPHLSSEQRASAKKVVADVESTVEQIDSGKLTGDARNKKVSLAVHELQTLEQEWLKTSTASRVQALQKQLATEKALLKEKETELKMNGLEKELLEKKMLLKKLTAEKDQAEALEKERKEDQAQQAMVSKLLATAKMLAASKGKAKVAKKTSETPSAAAADVSISGILADLTARKNKVSASIDHLDAEEKKREADLSKAIKAGEHAPAQGKTDAVVKGQAMLKMLAKQQHRTYLKARAARESARHELEEGIQSVKKGDVKALSRLLGKMQTESKSLSAKSKNFLY